MKLKLLLCVLLVLAAAGCSTAKKTARIEKTTSLPGSFEISRGFDAYNRKEWDDALSWYTKAIEKNPLSTEAFYNRGIVHDYLENYEKALKDYSKAIQRNPNFGKAYNNRGIVFFKIGMVDRAITDYTRAIALGPAYADGYYNRGIVYVIIGEYAKAIDDYTMAIEYNGQFENAFNNRGIVFYELGNYQAAIEDYARAIELSPSFVDAYFNRGLAYIGLAETLIRSDKDPGELIIKSSPVYERAVEDFSTAIALDAKYAKAYYNRGYMHILAGSYEMAIKDYTSYIEIITDDPDAFYYRGVAYSRLAELNGGTDIAAENGLRGKDKKLGKALADLTQAIELDSSFVKAFYERSHVYKLLGKLNRANADLKKSGKLDPGLIE
jgi:tetratricopeptide (TPR) repeat protein